MCWMWGASVRDLRDAPLLLVSSAVSSRCTANAAWRWMTLMHGCPPAWRVDEGPGPACPCALPAPWPACFRCGLCCCFCCFCFGDGVRCLRFGCCCCLRFCTPPDAGWCCAEVCFGAAFCCATAAATLRSTLLPRLCAGMLLFLTLEALDASGCNRHSAHTPNVSCPLCMHAEGPLQNNQVC